MAVKREEIGDGGRRSASQHFGLCAHRRADPVDAWTAEAGTSRSAPVVRLIEEERRRRFAAEMERAYRELTADGFFEDVEFCFAAGAEVLLAEPVDP